MVMVKENRVLIKCDVKAREHESSLCVDALVLGPSDVPGTEEWIRAVSRFALNCSIVGDTIPIALQKRWLAEMRVLRQRDG